MEKMSSIDVPGNGYNKHVNGKNNSPSPNGSPFNNNMFKSYTSDSNQTDEL